VWGILYAYSVLIISELRAGPKNSFKKFSLYGIFFVSLLSKVNHSTPIGGHIKKKPYMYKPLEFQEYRKSNVSRLAQMIENPFKNFSATKLSNSVKPMSIVSFTDIFGKTHSIKCTNNTKVKEAMAFFSVLKSDTATLKNILSEYPLSYGRIPKRFLKELRSELKPMGFSNEFITKVAGY